MNSNLDFGNFENEFASNKLDVANKLKILVTDSFVEYYGEKYRSFIEKKMKDLKIVFFIDTYSDDSIESLGEMIKFLSSYLMKCYNVNDVNVLYKEVLYNNNLNVKSIKLLRNIICKYLAHKKSKEMNTNNDSNIFIYPYDENKDLYYYVDGIEDDIDSFTINKQDVNYIFFRFDQNINLHKMIHEISHYLTKDVDYDIYDNIVECFSNNKTKKDNSPINYIDEIITENITFDVLKITLENYPVLKDYNLFYDNDFSSYYMEKDKKNNYLISYVFKKYSSYIKNYLINGKLHNIYDILGYELIREIENLYLSSSVDEYNYIYDFDTLRKKIDDRFKLIDVEIKKNEREGR